jgi:hypothetical protein
MDGSTIRQRYYRARARSSGLLGGAVMPINEHEAKSNNDSNNCEHGVKQGSLRSEQRPKVAAAPKEKNHCGREDAKQHSKEWECPMRTNSTQ